MESADDLSYKIIFSGDGAGRLRDRVKEKLKEFMGDYTDDTLVEYVIVLLKNGRRKEEAKNELNVFLGDDSDAFVSWLWDHLQSNLNLYAQPKDSSLIVEQVAKQKPQSKAEVVKEVVKSDKLSKSRRVKDWKGVIRESAEPPPLRSAVIATVQSDNENHVNRSSPPQPFVHKKRGRSSQTDFTDESSQVKRAVSKSTVGGASRRLLQFAVRDAVGNSRSVGLTSEPSHKRLRSAVSTPTDESSLEERPPKIRSVARVPKAMEVAIKAVADAAQDVKVKSSGTVFDRLSHGSTEVPLDNEKHEADVPTYSGQYIDASMMEHDGRVGNNQSKMVNIHSNVNKHSGVSNSDNQKLVQPIASGESHDNNLVTASNGNGVPVIHAQKVVDQKTVPSPGVNPAVRSTDDMDSRSIFVSNVHFAATKDSISRHFNKFGEVLKVVILTEAATGQPKGSAYVEFMRKEDAENALSLDGTSFMSRILKVVKKSSGQQEAAAPVTTWPRGARGSPFAASRFGRVPFPRVSIPSPYRPRLPIKGGARSFQWKRDAQNSSSDGLSSPVAIPSPTTITPRSLTYVRTEAAKPI